MTHSYDAVVVGAGPNGLAAAITLARAGRSVMVVEAKQTPGGGCRTKELTLPGFHHDPCAAIHPMGVASPFFRELPLARYGLEWVHSPVALAHPLDDGRVGVLFQSLEKTCEHLLQDGKAWHDLMGPFVENSRALFEDILRPIRLPHSPLLMARFGMLALRSCLGLLNTKFVTDPARALFAGCAAHSFLPLESAGSGSFGLVLALTAHAAGWPCARGGSQAIIKALVAYLRELGGDVATGQEVRSLEDLPSARAVLFDLTPRQILAIAGGELSNRYQRKLQSYKYGPGVYKLDWALSEPIPWRNPECAQAATVHVGGSYLEIAESERAAWTNTAQEKPFVLVAQQSRFDPTRAPAGKHTGWAYCHVPHGSKANMTDRIESQIERFAPGFRDTILARHILTPAGIEGRNANMIGGDIAGGANTLRQVFFRPVARFNPYATSNPRLFICSSATPPGGGVHGMCGYWAAQSVLKRLN